MRFKVLTYEAWMERPQFRYGIEEIVNGEVRITPPPKFNIANINEELAWIVRSQVDRQRIRVVTGLFNLVIRKDPLTVLVPNLAVFERANIVETDGYVHSAPELVVEISKREKISDYASIGVPELWVLSPEARSVEIMQLSADQRLETVAIVNRGQIHPKLFPQVGVDVTSIWPR
jgi:Uma2 family endonuclease